MIVTNGATAKWGWVYVAARALYPFMVSMPQPFSMLTVSINVTFGLSLCTYVLGGLQIHPTSMPALTFQDCVPVPATTELAKAWMQGLITCNAHCKCGVSPALHVADDRAMCKAGQV
jgi:hypothetical protein